MTEKEFLDRFNGEKPILMAWGKYVQDEIEKGIKEKIGEERALHEFLKIPCLPRIKEDKSILAKAFSRGKNYSDPYSDITDKVGIRFVVLLIEDIKLINEIVSHHSAWEASKDRDFEKEREEHPVSFTYQSDHFIVRNASEIVTEGNTIPIGFPCEIQIRTILQHAYSELTHDTVYKPKTKPDPMVQRTIAKSMALIETTDNFFTVAKDLLVKVQTQEKNFLDGLTKVYAELAIPEFEQKTNQYLFQELAPISEDVGIQEIKDFIATKIFLKDRIASQHDTKVLYRQPIILLVYFLIEKKRTQLKKHFPLTTDELRPFFNDLGLSLDH
jgi:putative GTP pyrophosphokinase